MLAYIWLHISFLLFPSEMLPFTGPIMESDLLDFFPGGHRWSWTGCSMGLLFPFNRSSRTRGGIVARMFSHRSYIHPYFFSFLPQSWFSGKLAPNEWKLLLEGTIFTTMNYFRPSTFTCLTRFRVVLPPRFLCTWFFWLEKSLKRQTSIIWQTLTHSWIIKNADCQEVVKISFPKKTQAVQVTCFSLVRIVSLR